MKQKKHIPFKLMKIYKKTCQRLKVKALKNGEEKNQNLKVRNEGEEKMN